MLSIYWTLFFVGALLMLQDAHANPIQKIYCKVKYVKNKQVTYFEYPGGVLRWDTDAHGVCARLYKSIVALEAGYKKVGFEVILR